MIKRDTFIIAMNLINEHNAQLRRMMDLANTIGSNLLLISTESFYHDAISLVFKESFQDTDKLLDWCCMSPMTRNFIWVSRSLTHPTPATSMTSW